MGNLGLGDRYLFPPSLVECRSRTPEVAQTGPGCGWQSFAYAPSKVREILIRTLRKLRLISGAAQPVGIERPAS
jgi:hypothetical protein